MTSVFTPQKFPPLSPGKPGPQEMNKLMALFNGGQYTEAAAVAQALTERFPNHGVGWNAWGMALQQLGRKADALLPMRKAAELSPDNPDAHYNLGIALQDSGLLDEAAASFKNATRLSPEDAEILNALGNTLQELGRADEAESLYRRALQFRPDYALAHHNLSIVLKDSGRLDDAVASCQRALQYQPDLTGTLNNLALLLCTQGKPDQALDIIKLSLRHHESAEAKSIFVACIKRMQFTHDDSEIRALMVRALSEPWSRPGELARASINLIRLNPEILACISRAARAWPRHLSAQELFGSNGLAAISADPLLLALLSAAPNGDIGVEHFLTMARRIMLDSAIGTNASENKIEPGLSFYSALARQCFINEYVFFQTAAEIRQVHELQDKLFSALNSDTAVPALWPIAIAAYFPLGSLAFSPKLQEKQWPEAVAALLVQQLIEPREELQLRTSIPCLYRIEDDVSLQVQNQYEENPYPRWIKAAPAGNAKNVPGYLRQRFPLVSFERGIKHNPIDILIAGCGTGQHSIQLAQLFQEAKILAVDLSLSSLAYARRKTIELGLTTIEYAQADLLKLGNLDRSFDIIESAGVLHHLADPWAGWRELLPLLRPGGFMMLGFYSEIARRNIVKARKIISERGYESTVDGIRQCRQDLIDLDDSAELGTTLQTADFFSTSTCRDLLFHVQEHRLTLPAIDTFLRDHHLAFLGFEIEYEVLQSYKLRFPEDPAACDLARWQIYENENPDTFIGMYQFWIQKPG